MNLRLENKDCFEIMAEYPDKYFDLALLDPEYGIGDKFKGGKTGKMNFNSIVEKGWDKKRPESIFFKEVFRISKIQIIWGGNYFISDLHDSRGILIWDKLVSENFSLAMFEMAWTNLDKLAKIFKMPSEKINRIHETQKPVKLYEKCLNYANATKEFKIIDTNLGSGSSLIAADKFGVAEFVGCEIDKEYYDNLIKRYNQFKSQTVLSFDCA